MLLLLACGGGNPAADVDAETVSPTPTAETPGATPFETATPADGKSPTVPTPTATRPATPSPAPTETPRPPIATPTPTPTVAPPSPTPTSTPVPPSPTPTPVPAFPTPTPTPRPQYPSSATIAVGDNYFSPATNVVIAAGGTVTWTWEGEAVHDVVSGTGAFPASPLQSSGSHRVAFNAPGTYQYYCEPHRQSVPPMRGVIEVR